MKRACYIFLMSLVALFLLYQTPLKADAASLTSSDSLITVLKTMEGFHKYPYEDINQWTVGYGTKCPDDKLAEYQTNGITVEEAEQLLKNMLSDFERSVNWYAGKYNLSLSQNQFDALVCFTYNCGAGWTTSVDGAFNKAVREGKRGSEFIYAICLWSVAGGQYVLMNRRLSEAYMYLDGVYEAYNSADDGTYPDTYRYVILDGNGGKSSYGVHGFHTQDPIAVITDFSSIPTGTNASGQTYNLTFDGWYTEEAGGTKIEVLDSSVSRGITLYAHWKDENGQLVIIPRGEICEPHSATVSSTVNIRKGPGTSYEIAGQLHAGDVITVTQTKVNGTMLWGKFESGWVSLEYTDYFQTIAPRSGKVNGTDVNIRTGPGTNYGSVGKLNTGMPVVIYEYEKGSGFLWGKIGDGNWIALKYVTFDPYVEEPDIPSAPDKIRGDMDGNGFIDVEDVVALLLHVTMPDMFEISGIGDMDGNGSVDVDDVVHLLLHVTMPDMFPL